MSVYMSLCCVKSPIAPSAAMSKEISARKGMLCRPTFPPMCVCVCVCVSRNKATCHAALLHTKGVLSFLTGQYYTCDYLSICYQGRPDILKRIVSAPSGIQLRFRYFHVLNNMWALHLTATLPHWWLISSSAQPQPQCPTKQKLQMLCRSAAKWRAEALTTTYKLPIYYKPRDWARIDGFPGYPYAKQSTGIHAEETNEARALGSSPISP